MKYSTIKALFYEMIGDSDINPRHITNDQAMMFANMAIRSAVDESKCLDRRQTILCTGGQAEYDLPSDCDSVYRAAYDGDKLIPVRQTKLDLGREEWRGDEGLPRLYYMDRLNSKIGLYEAPPDDTSIVAYDSEYGIVIDDGGTFDSEFGIIIDTSEGILADQEFGTEVGSVSSGELEVFFWASPEDITDDGDSIPLPSWASYYVLYSMLSDAYMADTQIQDAEASQAYKLMSEQIIPRLRGRSFAKTNKVYRMGRHQTRPRSRRTRFPDTIPDAGTADL